MKKELKRALYGAFEAPESQRKNAFLKNIRQPGIGYFKFVLLQASYIRKWVWGLSVTIFAAALIGGGFMERDVVWVLSALMPYLAAASIAESVRSEMYGMAELEMASRFPLKSVMLARMGILGVFHLTLLGLLVPFEHMYGVFTAFQTGVYLLVPYLLTNAGGLWLVRKIRSREASYVCMGYAIIISAFPIVSKYTITLLYQPEVFGWWLVLLAILCVATAVEYRKTVIRAEELI
ncbi:hypothetical protein EDD76_107180 [Kineothrix alysoides]|uniref:ABC-2 family transporter n=1 Tax=Kineothrix alysoides TaxID=1469948 RepID=A0A4R1QYM2_9FIRM|nr:hypothetical protein [Kineothrix alysoides]TCL58065.1 hypothetical protein EDD76_107180 [Kineothrix alysoides]